MARIKEAGVQLALDQSDYKKAERLAQQLVQAEPAHQHTSVAEVPRLGPVRSCRATEDTPLFSVAPLRQWAQLLIAQANLAKWQEAHAAATRAASEAATLWALLQSSCVSLTLQRCSAL